MGLFSKKQSANEVPAEFPATAESVAGSANAAPLEPAASSTMPHNGAGAPLPSAAASSHSYSHSVGESLHTAKEATLSGASVAVLVLWSIAVTGWTGFQIVQNALVWTQLQWLGFPKAANPEIPNNGYPGIDKVEIRALWALLAIECVILVFFLAMVIALMWVPYISACKQKRRARRTKRSFLPWFITLVLVAAAWFKLFTLSSVLNKMTYQGTWCAPHESLDIQYTFNPESAPPPTCQLAPMATGIRRVMVYAMLTIAFHMLMFFVHQPKGTIGKLYGLIPAIIVVALLLLKPVTSLMNMHFTQEAFVSRGNFTFPAEMIVALIEFVTAVWLSLYMGWAIHSLRLIPRFTNTLLACCGRRYEDVYYDREPDVSGSKADLAETGGKPARKSYSLRAASKSVVQQYYYMAQLPSVFGFVSPMITYFALNITNWWIIADIIVGAALIFIFMLLCALHRKVLAPSKH